MASVEAETPVMYAPSCAEVLVLWLVLEVPVLRRMFEVMVL